MFGLSQKGIDMQANGSCWDGWAYVADFATGGAP